MRERKAACFDREDSEEKSRSLGSARDDSGGGWTGGIHRSQKARGDGAAVFALLRMTSGEGCVAKSRSLTPLATNLSLEGRERVRDDSAGLGRVPRIRFGKICRTILVAARVEPKGPTYDSSSSHSGLNERERETGTAEKSGSLGFARDDKKERFFAALRMTSGEGCVAARLKPCPDTRRKSPPSQCEGGARGRRPTLA